MESNANSLHQRLVDELINEGVIRTQSVEAAWRAVPRHLFVPGVPLEEVYQDQVIVTKKLDSGEWVSSSEQPAVMAVMLEQLDLHPGLHVLEIGAGTGFMAALISKIIGEEGRVVTMDIDPELTAGASEHLAAAGASCVQVVCADGWSGHPDAAPYDRTILTVGSWDIAPAWGMQLADGGRLVLPLEIQGGLQRSIAFERTDGCLASRSLRPCGFMMLRGGSAPHPATRQLQLGPTSDISLAVKSDSPADPDAIFGWLKQTGREVAQLPGMIPGSAQGLPLWLAVHASDLSTLNAEGEAAARGAVPAFLKHPDSKIGWSVTWGLVGGGGMGVLSRRPSHRSATEGKESDSSYDLIVSSFGADQAPAVRLAELVREWDAAGRPTDDDARIVACPKETVQTRSSQEVMVEKTWTRLGFTWG